jgi:dipeptidyl aminopeptidase/acylaminoacyl peptidase
VQKSVNTPPFLIMHGDQDCWVPYQQSIQLADALDKKGADVTLRILLNSGHGSNHFSTAWRDHVKPFFDRTLAAVRHAVSSP